MLDFGSQYSQLIARCVRELDVYCELMPNNVDPALIEEFYPAGIILSGGPETVLSHETPRAPQVIFELGCPVFGICYGMQTMAEQLGGEVAADEKLHPIGVEHGEHTLVLIERKGRSLHTFGHTRHTGPLARREGVGYPGIGRRLFRKTCIGQFRRLLVRDGVGNIIGALDGG